MARSVFSEINRALKASIREAERRDKARHRERIAAERAAERARAQEKRAAALYVKAREKERKAAEKAAKQRHIERMMADVDAMNADLQAVEDDLQGLLSATLAVDDFVDLEALRRVHEPSPFDPGELAYRIEPPNLPELPKEPELVEPDAPSAVGRLLGAGRRYKKKLERAVFENKKRYRKWEETAAAVREQREAIQGEYEAREAERVTRLEESEKRHWREEEAARVEVEDYNKALDKLIADLGYGEGRAIEEYVEIVLSNSVYPECYPVESTGSFSVSEGELTIRAVVPEPASFSTVKAYRYVKAKDEIVSSELSQKAQRDRYAETIWQVALRTLHEVFEADRRGLIRTIALQVGTCAPSTATGVTEFIPFVGVGAEREDFLAIDLNRVVPIETLKFLGAAVSKNPFALTAANVGGIA
jgi:restriction system protein